MVPRFHLTVREYDTPQGPCCAEPNRVADAAISSLPALWGATFGDDNLLDVLHPFLRRGDNPAPQPDSGRPWCVGFMLKEGDPWT